MSAHDNYHDKYKQFSGTNIRNFEIIIYNFKKIIHVKGKRVGAATHINQCVQDVVLFATNQKGIINCKIPHKLDLILYKNWAHLSISSLQTFYASMIMLA